MNRVFLSLIRTCPSLNRSSLNASLSQDESKLERYRDQIARDLEAHPAPPRPAATRACPKCTFSSLISQSFTSYLAIFDRSSLRLPQSSSRSSLTPSRRPAGVQEPAAVPEGQPLREALHGRARLPAAGGARPPRARAPRGMQVRLLVVARGGGWCAAAWAVVTPGGISFCLVAGGRGAENGDVRGAAGVGARAVARGLRGGARAGELRRGRGAAACRQGRFVTRRLLRLRLIDR